jgi:hypothetical protein
VRFSLRAINCLSMPASNIASNFRSSSVVQAGPAGRGPVIPKAAATPSN